MSEKVSLSFLILVLLSPLTPTRRQVSNFVFVLSSPVLLCLSQNYANNVSRGIYVIWLLFAVVGLTSAYFHATLSLLGQLLDELSILWLLSAAFAMWLPRDRYPKHFNGEILYLRHIDALNNLIAYAEVCVNSGNDLIALFFDSQEVAIISKNPCSGQLSV